MARAGALKDASCYFSKVDQLAPSAAPTSILDVPATGNPTLNTDFSAAEIGVELVGGLRMSDPATSPIAFTRGLTTAGTWAKDKGAYKDTGGYIALVGGNVAFYIDLTGDNEISASNGRKTSNILQALPYRGTDSATNRNPRAFSSGTHAGTGGATGVQSATPPTS